ncbi:hypothetical protein OHC33_010484 [Knufia fluminis]|uniref:LYC1 C-terminal domain-containing protein n=1 Tax=Knufia fluminis TaxID=191047 RepID=A0AAN8EFJ4_9EURO|nr:hypothetical protein OHC33_010484 [Knufia fluminis]
MPAAREQSTGLVTTAIQPHLEVSTLPPKSDPNVVLERASRPEYEQTWRLNSSEWKGFLSEPSYLDREQYLLGAEVTREGGSTGWILTSPELPKTEDGSRPILAACETTRKHAYVAKDGKIDKVVSHGIGSVYCRPEYRGRGYAGKMIEELGKKLETHQQLKEAKGRFSVLYSDIGTKFYAKYGWHAFPSTHINLKPIDNAGEHHQRRAEITPPPQIEDLKYENLAALPLTPNLERKLAKMSSANPSKTFVAFRPDLPNFQWHFMREEFLAEALGREKPQIKGAIDRKTGIALIWVRTYSEEPSGWHLNVLYTHIPEDTVPTDEKKKSLSALLLRAQYEAHVWDMVAGLEVWDPSEEVVLAAKAIAYGNEIEVFSRDQEHVCSLKWNGSEADDVVWLANERYSWC